jgi:predicted kinase
MEKILFIVRGLPGSGKSTFASTISDVYFEADQFFMKNGSYEFDPSKIRDAHAWCLSQVDSMMSQSEPRIAVSNTFTQEWEMSAYYDIAKKHGYKVFSVIVENRHGGKNKHGVPSDKIQMMKDRFQISL